MLTIMISTKNRSDFLARLLNYYAGCSYNFRIDIGDSSDDSHFEKTALLVNGLKGKLKVKHCRHSGLRLPDSIRELTRNLETPYAAFIADDDFLVPSGFDKAMEFLEKNPDYSAAQGTGVLFSIGSSGPYGKFSQTSYYKLRQIASDTASARLIEHLSTYSVTLFAVYRTKTWQKMYEDVLKLEDRHFADEILPCALSVIYGKVKKLDFLYLVRQGHDRRNLLSDFYDWLTNKNWLASYEAFSRCLVKALMDSEAIDSQKALRVVKQAFWAYLNSVSVSQYGHFYKTGAKAFNIKNTLKKIPGIEGIKSSVKPFIASNRELLLPNLLKQSNRYHSDFMPVYKAVTAKGECAGV